MGDDSFDQFAAAFSAIELDRLGQGSTRLTEAMIKFTQYYVGQPTRERMFVIDEEPELI